MVPECWCVMSGQVEVGLKSIAHVGIEVLCLLNLVGTLMRVDPSSTLFLLSPSSTAPTSSVVFILFLVFPSLLIHASNFNSMEVIRLSSITPLPLSLLLLPEAADGAL